MSPTVEVKAKVRPSGERTALFIGLFQWLICVILAGPLGVAGRGQNRYPAYAAAKTTMLIPSPKNACALSRFFCVAALGSGTTLLGAFASPLTCCTFPELLS